jgi:hypothetical protein
MDIIEFIVFLSVVIVVLNIIKIFYFDIYVDIIKFNLFGVKAFFFPDFIVSIVRGSLSAFTNATIKIALIIIVFYIIFYIIYLIIVYILIPALIIFQPLFELILKIPPFPQLIKYGVFKLFDRLIEAFAIKTVLLFWLKTYVALFLFSYDNIAEIFNYIFPGLGDKIVEKMKQEAESQNEDEEETEYEKEKKRKAEEEKEKLKNEEKEKLKNLIDEETYICIAMNRKKITPDMTDAKITKTEFENNQIRINCNSSSITKYLKL